MSSNPYKSFENLELIPMLLKEIEEINKRLEQFTPKIDNKKAVINFLNISNSSFQNYLKDGRLKEGVHFYKKNGKMVFIENAIIELKNNNLRGRL
jgi:hypothetical protein